jgi:hypothetical protein
MKATFERTVATLCESIVRERCTIPAEAHEGTRRAVARFLLRTHGSMPDYLRLPLTMLTLTFDYSSLASTGRPFHRLPHERRARQIRAWKNSTFGVRRDLIKFYETLVIFGWYSELYGADYLEQPQLHEVPA